MDDCEITPEMIAAGEEVIWGAVGGSQDLGGFFDARALADGVYRAMYSRRKALPIIEIVGFIAGEAK